MAGRISNQPTLLDMYCPVKDIRESKNCSSSTNWPICVWVADKSDITWSQNKVKYLKLVLEDDSGRIQAMVYDRVEERNNTFKNEGINQKYIIRWANVKKTNKKFDTYGHDFELIITKSTKITPCTITKRHQCQDTEIMRPRSSQGQSSVNSKGQKEVKPKRKLNTNGNGAEPISKDFFDLEALASEDEFEIVQKQTSSSPPKKRKIRRSVRCQNRKPHKTPDYESQSEDGDDDDKTYCPTLLQPPSRATKRILRCRTRIDYSERLSDNLTENMNENSTMLFENAKEEQETISKYGRIRKRSSTRCQENQDPFEQRRKSLSRGGKSTAMKSSEPIIIVTDESSDEDFTQPQYQRNMTRKGVLEDSDDDDIVKTTICKKSLQRLSDQSVDDFVKHQHLSKDDEDSGDSDGSKVTPRTRTTPLKALEVTDESSGSEINVNSDDESNSTQQIESCETIHSHQSSEATNVMSERSDEESTQTSINEGLSSYSSSFNTSYEDNNDDADTDDDETDTDDDDDTSGDWPEYDKVKVDFQNDFENDGGKVASLVFTMIMKACGESEDDEKTRDLTTSLMKKINSKRDECVSQAWFRDLKIILESKPLFMKYEKTNRCSIEDLKDCEVCNRSGRKTEYRVELSGVPYDPDTLEPNNDEEEEVMKYLVGRFCYMRIRLYHELYHLQYNIYNDCKRKLEHYTRTPDKLMKNKAFINKYFRKISKLLRMVELEIFEDGDKRRRGTRFQREFNENFN